MRTFQNLLFNFIYLFRIVCPENEDDSSRIVVTIWSIMSKVRLEAMMWGAGTALGELPPYFMARAARLSSMKSRRNGRRRSTSKTDDIESLAEFQELQKKQQNPQQLVPSLFQEFRFTYELFISYNLFN